MKHSLNIIFTLVLALIASSCSTTARLETTDVLYTGVKKVYYMQENTKIDGDVQSQIFEAINVAPNNPFYSPYYRTPLPIGLWVYNHWNPEAKGVKGWLYRKLVAQPVLISTVKPDTRVDMINTLLHNNGYFSSKASYQLNYSSKNKRKASITYNVEVNKPHTIGEITYTGDVSPVSHLIDSCARKNAYLQEGNRYCLDSLNAVRIEIANTLRNNGYYYYKPEYIEYLADSTITQGHINLQIIQAANVPNIALVRFLTNNVYITLQNAKERSFRTDTLHYKHCTVYKKLPVNVKSELVASLIRSRHHRPLRVENMDRTQMYLSRTGFFSSIDMKVVNTDTLTADGDGLVDIHITCIVDDPYEATLEARGTTKSNGFLGPGFELNITNKNFNGGGERLSGKLKASYEWQTRPNSAEDQRDGDINSYEVGLNVEMAYPRLLFAPKTIRNRSRYVNWTRFNISSDFINRPSFFKMEQIGADMSWEWHSSRTVTHVFTPFKLTYSKMLKTSEAFDSTMFVNPSLWLSFRDNFVPELNYTFTYEKQSGDTKISFTTTATEAGSIFSGIWRLCGKKGEKRLFGTPFSQFVRWHSQLVWNRTLAPDFNIVGRVQLGIAHAFGNSTEVPYSYQFYVGGANSLRGFTVRSVGPGSYKSMYPYGYFDQTGTFKFETNWEVRFPLAGYLKGALFVDAGNVWLLENDEYRPGGNLTAKTFLKEIALNTGAGVRLDMGMLVLRADMGIALHSPYTTTKSGYFNIEKFKDALAFYLAVGYPF